MSFFNRLVGEKKVALKKLPQGTDGETEAQEGTGDRWRS